MNYVCNPLNLKYQYQYRNTSKEGDAYMAYREAADPSVIWFQGKYYMFASMSLGVYVSEDLVNWELHKLNDEFPFYGYAPDACVAGDEVYLCACEVNGKCDFYRTKDILNGPYEEIKATFQFADPKMFCDDDGRIYFYWGCSDRDPLYGAELNRKTLEWKEPPKNLIYGNPKQVGFERFGEDHITKPEESEAPWLEGAWMTKYKGKYYLQYAAPATEFSVYADGVYISDNPLGPFTLARNNPYSYHPGGFMTGAGHGSTFTADGKHWFHASTMQISVTNPYERRLGIWRAGFDEDGELYCDQRFGDWPVAMEDLNTPFKNPPFWLLSYRKPVTASSIKEGTNCEAITDENAKTVWQAEERSAGEWIMIDLEEEMDVRAIQINFADHQWSRMLPEGKFADKNGRYIEEKEMHLRWYLEVGTDGEIFEKIWDCSNTDTDLCHDFKVWEEGKNIKFLKLTILEMPYGQPACLSGLRVFGHGKKELPKTPVFCAKRIGNLDMEVSIETQGAVGYQILWGNAPDKLYHSFTIYEPENGKICQRIGALIEVCEYFVRVDAFNESGIAEGVTRKL